MFPMARQAILFFLNYKAKKAKLHNTNMEEHGDKVRDSFDEKQFDDREPTRNEPLIMYLPKKDHESFPKLFFVDVLIGGHCVPTIIDVGATKNFMSKRLQQQVRVQAVDIGDSISCQFLSNFFEISTKKVPRA